MSKLPAIQFYTGDWRKDPGVQSLGFHDRGVWFEILCLMHESETRGKLLLNGAAMPEEALARVLGLDQKTLSKTLKTLESYGVSSRCETTGALMSRRMVRDEGLRGQRKIDGASGGNPALCAEYKEPGFVYAIRRPSDGAVKIGIAKNVTNRLYKLRNQFKETLEILGFSAVQNMGAEEALLHTQFAEFKLVGEWFLFPTSESLNKMLFTLKGKSNHSDNGKERASVRAYRAEAESEDEEGENKQEQNTTSPFDAFREPIERLFGKPITIAADMQLGSLMADLIQAGASPDELERRATHYRLCWPNAACTLRAIVNNWAIIPSLKPPKIEKKREAPQLDWVS